MCNGNPQWMKGSEVGWYFFKTKMFGGAIRGQEVSRLDGGADRDKRFFGEIILETKSFGCMFEE